MIPISMLLSLENLRSADWAPIGSSESRGFLMMSFQGNSSSELAVVEEPDVLELP